MMDYDFPKSTRDYILRFGDMPRYEQYKNEHLDASRRPPVFFTANGENALNLPWRKETGEQQVFTDYPTDRPVKRTQRQDVYICDALGLAVEVTVAEYPDFPVAEYLPRLKNIGSRPSPEIQNLCCLRSELYRDADILNIHHNNGGSNFNNEYAPFTDELHRNGGQHEFRIDNRCGLGTGDHLPAVNIENQKAGNGIILVVSWSADWRIFLHTDTEGRLFGEAGQRRTDFVLLPGEEIRLPMTVLLFYRGEWVHGQNIWRHWYYRHNVLRAQGVRMTTNLLHCISTDNNGMLNSEAENLPLVAKTTEYKLNRVTDYINQDAGWYQVRPGYGWEDTGNWFADPERYPRGLKPVADAVHKQGMLYSVWFEPERLRPGSQTFEDLGKNALYPKQLPDGSLVLADPDEIPTDGNALANYADPAVVDYFTEKLDSAFRAYGIDQYRQDENFGSLAPYFEAADNTEARALGMKREGITEAKFVAGYHRLWDELLKRTPGLIIDACAGGGRRNDLETVRQSFIHTRTDFFTDTNYAQCQTYGMSMWYMLMGSAFLDPGDEYDRRSRLVSSLGYAMGDEAWLKAFRRAVKLWQGYMANFFCNYYPLTPYTTAPNGNLAMQFDELDSGTGLVAAYLRAGGALTCRLMGLCPEERYEYYSEDSPRKKTQKTGAELMTEGITLQAPGKAALIIYYKRL